MLIRRLEPQGEKSRVLAGMLLRECLSSNGSAPRGSAARSTRRRRGFHDSPEQLTTSVSPILDPPLMSLTLTHSFLRALVCPAASRTPRAQDLAP